MRHRHTRVYIHTHAHTVPDSTLAATSHAQWLFYPTGHVGHQTSPAPENQTPHHRAQVLGSHSQVTCGRSRAAPGPTRTQHAAGRGERPPARGCGPSSVRTAQGDEDSGVSRACASFHCRQRTWTCHPQQPVTRLAENTPHHLTVPAASARERPPRLLQGQTARTTTGTQSSHGHRILPSVTETHFRGQRCGATGEARVRRRHPSSSAGSSPSCSAP